MDATRTIDGQLMEAATCHPWLEGEEVHPDVLGYLFDVAEEAWDGCGWYQVGTGRTTWDLAECYDVGDAIDLAVYMYADYTHGHGCLRDVWTVKITDPEFIAEFESEWE